MINQEKAQIITQTYGEEKTVVFILRNYTNYSAKKMEISNNLLAKILTVCTAATVQQYTGKNLSPNSLLKLNKAYAKDIKDPNFFNKIQVNYSLLTEHK